ncbi:hypothetical protein P1X14_13770 [Sphingomonas sp. AOB5]|uniref:hypothetical protein n=1 Tax=Sphingomonas sp. AOB5 TaxID=3034017 RepID=UPI0023FA155B|nr:hypothetical protein [Sphingomonas sp. AOB5]MDF7776319.1 hypothetical protein [Sphingomonas sp. AOB5]
MRYKIAAFAAAAFLAAAPALAEDWDFILINNSGKSIKTFEISAAGAAKWEPNKVDPEIKRDAEVKNGGRTTIHFDKGDGCKYDLKATFSDDTSLVWTNINVCDNAYVTIKLNAAGAPVFTSN